LTDLEAGETGPEDSRPTTPYRQTVRSAAGFAYGVIGADLHVFGDGVPLYLLLNWQGEAAMDSAWLRRMPSRMLNARFAVVPFTGRGRALEELRRWRDDDRDRLSIRWLHSEGGSGKSRLAARLCGESAAAGWKVIVAVPGPGGVFPPPGSQDLSADGADGLLLLVDYADRWPETHLAWLLSNALLHRPQPRVRVLMIARTISPLPRLRAALADQQVEVSSQHLPALRADAAEEGDDAADPADDGRGSGRTCSAPPELPSPSATASPTPTTSRRPGRLTSRRWAWSSPCTWPPWSRSTRATTGSPRRRTTPGSASTCLTGSTGTGSGCTATAPTSSTRRAGTTGRPPRPCSASCSRRH
jgi:hypothetical protein